MSKYNRACHYKGGTSDKVYLGCIAECNGKYVVICKWGRTGSKLQSQEKGTFDSLKAAASKRDSIFNSKTRKGYVDIESPSYRQEGALSRSPWLRQYFEDEPKAKSAVTELSPNARQEAEKLILQGKKIAAVRLVQDDTNRSSRESKDIVDEIDKDLRKEREGESRPRPKLDKVEKLVRQGKKLEAVSLIESDGYESAEAEEIVVNVLERISKETSKSEWEVVCENALGLEASFDEGLTYVAKPHPEEDMIYVWDRNGEKQECFKERFKKA